MKSLTLEGNLSSACQSKIKKHQQGHKNQLTTCIIQAGIKGFLPALLA